AKVARSAPSSPAVAAAVRSSRCAPRTAPRWWPRCVMPVTRRWRSILPTDVPQPHRAIVSFDDEALVLVDADDREIGFLDKASAHDGEGVLHRAFSLFIFNPQGELLLQQRAADKRLWPGFWANSCCSHPRRGESMQDAIRRRLDEELGLDCALHFLFKFQYQARYG